MNSHELRVLRRAGPRWWGAMVLLMIGASCDGRDSVGPGGENPFRGTYVLAAVDGNPLPVVITSEPGDGESMRVETGTLTFPFGQHMEFRVSGPLLSADMDPIPTVHLTFAGPFERRGADSLVADPVVGRAWSDSVELRTTGAAVFASHTWLFTRPSQP